MCCSALTLPKYLATSRTSSSGASATAVPPPAGEAALSALALIGEFLSSACRLGAAVDERVDQHGQEQHDAQEGEVPRAVPARVDHALEGHADDAGAEGGADGRAVPAGEQAPAHHRGDDVVELIPHTLLGHGGGRLGEGDDPDQARG